MDQIIQVPAYLQKIVSLRNGAVKLYFETQENIDPNVLSYFLGRTGSVGWLNYAAREVSVDDLARLDPLKPDADEKKSPSERLRGVMYVLWKKLGNTLPFETYYRQVMEQLIEKYKEKIPQ